MKDKLSAFERRLEILFLLNKCKETTAVKLAYYFAVSKDTIFRDVDFLNRYAPIYTKRGMFGGIFINDESRKNLFLYLSDNEEKLLKKLSANLDDTAKYYINNILNKYSEQIFKAKNRYIILSFTKKARKITAVQYNGKQIHSGMDEPSGRYAKTIVLLLLHPSF